MPNGSCASRPDGLEGRTEETQFPSVSALRQSALMQHCPIRGAPKCPPASKRYRTHDGTCNNLNRPRWGSTMTPVQRFLTPVYSDGLQAPRRSVSGSPLPSAREISSLIHEDQNIEAPGITHLLMQWGQFLDHDVTSSSQSRGFNGSVPRCCKDGGRDFVPKEFMHPECLPIAVPASDPFYGPRGVRCLDFVRSSPAPRDDCALGWREQLNQVSAYIDASPLYGSSARKSDKLRLFRNGMLQYGRVQQRRPILPPERRDELCRGGAVSTDCFKSGDARVNEHPGLVAAHILWLRQHNRMAQELAHLNPHWSDEKIYQETRKIVGAMVQHITYKEFLPIVLGVDVMRLFDLDPQKKGFYKNYNPKINPSPASSFGSAAFRFGHSLVQPSMVRYDRFHRPINNNVSLHNELTNPSNIWSMGAVDRLLLGMMNQPSQKRDEFITEELTNHLFQTPQFDFGMDLAAINIQRGRDHGVPPYTAFREPCGLSQITEFEDLFRVIPARTVRKLQAIYRNVDDIDLFTGGMAERPVVGGLVGPTFACIIAQQFSNLRKGDRFWYENGGLDSSFTPAQLQQIRRITFAQVLCRTLDNIDNIQPFVFLSPNSPENQRISCSNGILNNFDLSPWIEIDSNSNNDIRKSDDNADDRDIEITKTSTTPSLTTTKQPTTQKPITNMTDKVSKRKTKPTLAFTNTTITNRLNKTETDKTNMTHKHKGTVQKIDDKLDFKNKSKRFDNVDRIDDGRNRPTMTKSQYNDDYDDDDDTQSVQSVVINNLSHKRPSSLSNSHNRPTYNRPIAVTENIDKYTYLINYVPRPTQSWRRPERTTRRPERTTRRTYTDRDVVKVTYQTYDDTYRRPNNPYYYNRQDDIPLNPDSDFRQRPHRYTTNSDDNHSSARSNDENTDKTKDLFATTDNLHKLVTFGYVGTYKGDLTKRDQPMTKENTDATMPSDKGSDGDKTNDSNISRDFSTYNIDKSGPNSNKDSDNSMKLSTFFHYESATKPYNLQRSTRKEEEPIPNTDGTNDKYYYVRNVLHKYPTADSTLTDKTLAVDEEQILKENYNSPGWPSYLDVQERTSLDKLALLDEAQGAKSSLAAKRKKPQQSTAKTPSVAFQVMPSENSPTQWAVYEEDVELQDGLPHVMPTAQTDPYSLKEIPRPMKLRKLKKRRRGRA
ncbi:unnamed protein product [Plutella xylostella]|uniref:(diamondback moth) hypothetical protein n=1 Tax=Plutella xylostella TaxID=51655 RepID=A0A8S4D987_PLUXY|nr:unnamed protein product [Plutella xylostella]